MVYGNHITVMFYFILPVEKPPFAFQKTWKGKNLIKEKKSLKQKVNETSYFWTLSTAFQEHLYFSFLPSTANIVLRGLPHPQLWVLTSRVFTDSFTGEQRPQHPLKHD